MSYTLFILLLLCHFAGDFTHLSRPYMLAAKRNGRDIVPILHHAMVHGVLMGIVCVILQGIIVGLMLGLVQTMAHFIIDFVKGRLQGQYEVFQSPASYWHWYLFGADQVLHILVILLMTYVCSL